MDCKDSFVKELKTLIRDKTKNIVILSGAGISEESGIPTFRGENGLWKNYRPEELATPEAFLRDSKLVWEFYDWRRVKIKNAKPNDAHIVLSLWERKYRNVSIITQNVDGLHRRAGSKRVIEIHGNIWKVLCTKEGHSYYDYRAPLCELPPRCKECGGILRPGVVWFGEMLPQEELYRAYELSEKADLMFVVGTSGAVYPASELPLISKRKGAVLVEVNVKDTFISSVMDYRVREKSAQFFSKLNDCIEGS